MAIKTNKVITAIKDDQIEVFNSKPAAGAYTGVSVSALFKKDLTGDSVVISGWKFTQRPIRRLKDRIDECLLTTD